MPWQEITAVDLRTEFVELNRCGTLSFSELCRRYGISRKTGYKWLNRYAEQGVEGLQDRSRRPARHRLKSSSLPVVTGIPPGVRASCVPCWPARAMCTCQPRAPSLRFYAATGV